MATAPPASPPQLPQVRGVGVQPRSPAFVLGEREDEGRALLPRVLPPVPAPSPQRAQVLAHAAAATAARDARLSAQLRKSAVRAERRAAETTAGITPPRVLSSGAHTAIGGLADAPVRATTPEKTSLLRRLTATACTSSPTALPGSGGRSRSARKTEAPHQLFPPVPDAKHALAVVASPGQSPTPSPESMRLRARASSPSRAVAEAAAALSAAEAVSVGSPGGGIAYRSRRSTVLSPLKRQTQLATEM